MGAGSAKRIWPPHSGPRPDPDAAVGGAAPGRREGAAGRVGGGGDAVRGAPEAAVRGVPLSLPCDAGPRLGRRRSWRAGPPSPSDEAAAAASPPNTATSVVLSPKGATISRTTRTMTTRASAMGSRPIGRQPQGRAPPVSSAAVAGDTAAELRSAREDVRQLLWPLLSACRSRSVDLELQLKGEQFKTDSMLSEDVGTSVELLPPERQAREQQP
ncbi:uncharacterized protein LOC120707026 [Panicum virgatum]|uniref:uncharacterized protein LOC120707026 n=1 Tax=Panicum virgatum TaxID=38727 RepID=UPI0019D6155E|nr:uncharacterized protein LOC120707026 [Panicum virgatum]